MRSVILISSALFLVCGCTRLHRYDVDLSNMEGFQWNGKLVIANSDKGFFAGRKTDYVALASDDGRFVILKNIQQWPKVRLVANDDTLSAVELTVNRRSGVPFLFKGPKKSETVSWEVGKSLGD